MGGGGRGQRAEWSEWALWGHSYSPPSTLEEHIIEGRLVKAAGEVFEVALTWIGDLVNNWESPSYCIFFSYFYSFFNVFLN